MGKLTALWMATSFAMAVVAEVGAVANASAFSGGDAMNIHSELLLKTLEVCTGLVFGFMGGAASGVTLARLLKLQQFADTLASAVSNATWALRMGGGVDAKDGHAG